MKKLKGENILVTGGTGFVGSHLVEELVKQRCNVITTYQTQNPQSYFMSKKLDKKVTMIRCNIGDYESVFDVITRCNITYIFHLAAQPLVDVAYYNPRQTLESNINGTINILESVRMYAHVRGVIVASSDKAYGKLSDGKYTEANPLRGDHPYEVSKSAADLITSTYIKTYGIPAVITRFGNIYGEGDLNYSRIIPGIMQSLITKKSLTLRSDGTFVRDYLYVRDVVRGYIALAEDMDKVRGQSYNFGSDDTLSVIDLIAQIEKVLKKKVPYEIKNTAQNEIPYQSLDYSKIKKQIGWMPKNNIKNTMHGIYHWYLQLLRP